METPAAPTVDQRSGKRFTLVLRAAKLVAPVGDYLCVLRDVSEGGVKLRLFHDLPAIRPLELELGNGLRHRVEPVWQRGDLAGFRFVRGPVILPELLGMTGPFPRRGVRLRAELPVTVSGPDGTHAATLRDISLDGARIDSATIHPLSARLVIASGQLPAIPGRVRWRSGQAHGIAFERHFALDELARLLAPAAPEVTAVQAKLPAR
jgi:hypothetical protein